MDIKGYLEQFIGREIVAYGGRMKYRGVFDSFLDGDYILLSGVVVMNTSSQETSEFSSCVVNIKEISSIAFQ